MTQQEFNQMLAVAIAGGLGGGTYISRWDGEQVDDGVDKVLLPGGITTTELADGTVTWPKLAVDARPIRDNLLRNAYFIGGGSQQGGGQFPVNQQGQTEYIGTRYNIDGWMTFYYPSTITLTEQGLHITATGTYIFQQRVMPWAIAKVLFAGYPYTLSFLTAGGLTSTTYAFTADTPDTFESWSPNVVENSSHAVMRVQGENLVAQLYGGAGETVPLAAKLELGDQQTLAHQDADGNWVLNDPPPDFGLELLRCQRYQKAIQPATNYGRYGDGLIGNRGNLAYINVPLSAPLRSVPSVDFTGDLVIWDGKENYPVQSIVVANVSTDICNLLVTFNGSLAIGTYVHLTASDTVNSKLLLDSNP